MRKALLIAATAVVLSTPALAQRYEEPNPYAGAAIGTGVVAGTVAGVAVHQGWIGGSLGAALPTSAAGAAAVGGVVGVGTVAGIDAVVQPCRGLQAVFGMNREYCGQRQAAIDGQLIGDTPRRRVVRR